MRPRQQLLCHGLFCAHSRGWLVFTVQSWSSCVGYTNARYANWSFTTSFVLQRNNGESLELLEPGLNVPEWSHTCMYSANIHYRHLRQCRVVNKFESQETNRIYLFILKILSSPSGHLQILGDFVACSSRSTIIFTVMKQRGISNYSGLKCGMERQNGKLSTYAVAANLCNWCCL